MSTIPIAYTVSPTLDTKITETPLLTKAKIDKTWVPMVPGARIINIDWGLLDYPDPTTVGFDDESNVDPRVMITWCFAKGIGIGEGLKGWRPPARVRDRVDENAGGQRMSIQDFVPGQKIGDIFRAMRVQKQVREVKGGPRTSLTMEVGDCCKVLEMGINPRGKDLDKEECKVRNLRTEMEVWIPWNTFLKVGGREVCGCAGIGKKQGILK
ncbi:hypothetical protein DL95DRAFT_485780 [Leptodontidium sp. 2 PMI_412]|nr:hypothetical protein DL95DRAFT_485780 [Leptodontidium sp. 2 PMI_412]